LLGGWLGEHVGLRSALVFAGSVSLLLAAVAWRLPLIRDLKRLPSPAREPGLDEVESEWTGLPS
jgi:predicted MFS family arabinose efflux permease